MTGPEAEFQDAVRELCRYRRLLCYHTYDARRSDQGFLDLVIVGGNGFMVRELKSETGKVSEAQQYWLDRWADIGVDAGVWRPHQLSTDVPRQLARLTPLRQWPPPRNAKRRPSPHR